MLKSIKKIFVNTNTSKLTFIIKEILFWSDSFPKSSIARSKSPASKVKAAPCVQTALVETHWEKEKNGRMGKYLEVVIHSSNVLNVSFNKYLSSTDNVPGTLLSTEGVYQ